jgi:hypothetical protein
MAETWPVELKIVATIYDPETGQAVEEPIEVDNTKPAPMQAINLELDKLGYSPLFFDGRFGKWRTTERGARRV